MTLRKPDGIISLDEETGKAILFVTFESSSFKSEVRPTFTLRLTVSQTKAILKYTDWFSESLPKPPASDTSKAKPSTSKKPGSVPKA